MADLGVQDGSVTGGSRPVLIIQNDVGNLFSDTVIVAPLTSKFWRRHLEPHLPTHVRLAADFLEYPSVVMLEQIRCIGWQKTGRMLGRLSTEQMEAIDKALRISIGLGCGR